MKKLAFVILLLAGVLLVSACQQATPSETTPEETAPPPPADQKFSLGISDDSGGNKNGAPLLTLKFGTGTPGSTTIVAKKGTPTIDGNDDAAGWGLASAVKLPLSVQKGGGPSEATVKAAYDDNYLYFSVKWQDPTGTKNINKKMWTYSAADGTWTQSGNEDRVYFLFNISATDFDGGCAVYCHVGNPDWDKADDSKMGANNPGEMIDVWHWKATRTNPSDHAEDKHWVALAEANEIPYEGEMLLKTRLADAGDGFDGSNSDNGLPEFMHKSDPGANSEFLFADVLVPFDPDAGWSDGDTIPGYTVKTATGSRADVTAVSSYTNGTWLVEFKRRLITNNPDDVQFK